jgi:H+-transporting ATPase
MLGLLALLNESAVLSIATDTALAAGRPAATNARHALAIATLLGVTGLLASFGMFDLGRQEFHLDGGALQTLMYLQLSVAGQLTIFLTRSRRAFWSSRPSGTILVAVGSAQILATLFAVYGVFMTPLGWSLAGTVWAYTLVWLLLADCLKLLLRRLLDGNAATVEDVSPHRIEDPASEPSAAR